MIRKFAESDHFVTCDICGAKRYRSECSYTWDDFLACHTSNCWYPKDPIFIIPPIINDPFTIQDVRPEPAVLPTVAGSELLGYSSTWSFITNPIAISGTVKWNAAPLKWGDIDSDPWALPE